MTYADLFRALYLAGYSRVERDDRLLDIFRNQTREKGVELWEKWPLRGQQEKRWGDDDIRLIRLRVPFETATVQMFEVSRGQLESLLMASRPMELDAFAMVAEGEAVLEQLYDAR